jgi:predicted nucleotidyltransferase
LAVRIFFAYLCSQTAKRNMRRPEVVDRIRDAAKTMQPNVQTILYGSEARCEARPDSDIDLLLLVDKDKLTYNDKDRIIAPFYEIELDTGIIISMLIMPRKDWENRPFLTPFQYNVNKEGILL